MFTVTEMVDFSIDEVDHARSADQLQTPRDELEPHISIDLFHS